MVALGVAGAIGAVLGVVLVGRGEPSAGGATATSHPSGRPLAAAVHRTDARPDLPAGQRAFAPHRPLATTREGLTYYSAQPSTIPVGNIQFCAQGNYNAQIQIMPAPIPGSSATPLGLYSYILQPHPDDPGKACWMIPWETYGRFVDVEITGFDPATGQPFFVGRTQFNSHSGLGLGAEGTSASPFWWQW